MYNHCTYQFYVCSLYRCVFHNPSNVVCSALKEHFLSKLGFRRWRRLHTMSYIQWHALSSGWKILDNDSPNFRQFFQHLCCANWRLPTPSIPHPQRANMEWLPNGSNHRLHFDGWPSSVFGSNWIWVETQLLRWLTFNFGHILISDTTNFGKPYFKTKTQFYEKLS